MKDFKVINDRPSIVIVNTPAIDVNRLEGEFYKYDYLNAIDKIKKMIKCLKLSLYLSNTSSSI